MLPWREQEKEQIKSLERQVKTLKQKYEEEKQGKENLQRQVNELSSEHGATGNLLVTANELTEKLRHDLKKCSDQLEKSNKNQSHLEDRCHQLEARASGVDQTEIALQTTQKALENCQFKYRELERRFNLLTNEHEETLSKLQAAESQVKSLSCRVEDLNSQVLQELIKNERIEKKIEGLPYLEEQMADQETKLKQQSKELNQKAVLLTSSSKTLREYKEKLRKQETQLNEVKVIKDELDLAKNEVMTLKKLLVGKDVLVSQKSQALDFAKDVLEVVQYNSEGEKIEKVQELIDRSCNLLSVQSSNTSASLSFRSSASPDSENLWNDVDRSQKAARPWTSSAGYRDHKVNGNYRSRRAENGFLKKLLVDGDYKEGQKSSPRNHHCFDRRPYTSHGSLNRSFIHRKEEQNRLRYRPSVDLTPQKTQVEYQCEPIFNEDNNNNMQPSLKMVDIVNRIVSEKVTDGKHNIHKQEDIYSLFIKLGDRVYVKFPQHNQHKALRNPVLQRFGSKRESKRKLYCGIVKYLGPLGLAGGSQIHLYVGLNLDEPVGDTDGKVGDHHVMYTDREHGKFVPITNIVSVFDVTSSRYVELSALQSQFTQRRKSILNSRET